MQIAKLFVGILLTCISSISVFANEYETFGRPTDWSIDSSDRYGVDGVDPTGYPEVVPNGSLKDCDYAKICDGFKEVPFHTAIDYDRDSGSDEVRASAAGYVADIVRNGDGDHGLGNVVILLHFCKEGCPRGYIYTLYAHLDDIDDAVIDAYNSTGINRWIPKGQTLGDIGGTGNGKEDKWPDHLHFEFKLYGELEAWSCGSVDIGRTHPFLRWQPCYGYVSSHPDNHGYFDPSDFIGKIEAFTPFKKGESEPTNTDSDGGINPDGTPIFAPGPQPLPGTPTDLRPDFDIVNESGQEISANSNTYTPKHVVVGQRVQTVLTTQVENRHTKYSLRDDDSDSIEGPIWWRILREDGSVKQDWNLLISEEFDVDDLRKHDEPDEKEWFTIPNFPGYIIEFLAAVDGDDEVKEEDEGSRHKIRHPNDCNTNNCSRHERLYIDGVYDLSVTSLTHTGANKEAGSGNFQITATIKNHRDQTQKWGKVKVWFNGHVQERNMGRNMQAGESWSTSFTFAIPHIPGTYEIIALADPDGWIHETDGNNNRRTTNVVAQPRVIPPDPEPIPEPEPSQGRGLDPAIRSMFFE